MASVEAQRNEALQSVSQEVKEIWEQKEMVEVSLAQLDSFTRFAEYTNKCTTNASYVAMATQCIKLIERLKDTHGDQGTLNQKKMAIGSGHIEGPLHVPLDKLFSLNHPLLKLSPAQGSLLNLPKGTNKISIEASLVAGELPVLFPPLPVENCKLDVKARYKNHEVPTEVSKVNQSSWKIIVTINIRYDYTYPLTIKCRLSGTVPIEIKFTYEV